MPSVDSLNSTKLSNAPELLRKLRDQDGFSIED
jgi:hypothetical protein